jgi:hypothetical protein
MQIKIIPISEAIEQYAAMSTAVSDTRNVMFDRVISDRPIPVVTLIETKRPTNTLSAIRVVIAVMLSAIRIMA